MAAIGYRQEGFDHCPDGIDHFGFEGAHDDKASTWSSVDGSHPASEPGHHDDRWMVTYPRES
jgi:hypothetical protein